MNRSVAWFLIVGATAAATHFFVFYMLRHSLLPEIANAIGFVVALFVSFGGHRWLSFSNTDTDLLTSLKRFSVTALTGFACNEIIFVILYRWLDMPSLWALLIALVIAAAQTYVLSRWWAFRISLAG
ncbi:MAG: GtrA family protein [Limnohabitans sp.]|nr:GtrA family protein [Limnohabitans sp.]